MSILDGRKAVQERVDAIGDELAALVAILDGYARLEAIQQPEPEPAETPAPVPTPIDTPPRKHKRETFVCSRCEATFKTKGWRDRHQAKHPPIPDGAPGGGERIRRTPPLVLTNAPTLTNGSPGLGQ